MHDAEVTVWDQSVFELSATTIESLTKTLKDNDFGIFVFSRDDLLKIRAKESHAVRDNVLFEFGLFIGRMGRERVFFLLPTDGDLHLPSDLLGVTAGRYDPVRTAVHLLAAIGAMHPDRIRIGGSFDRLAGGPALRTALLRRDPPERILASWQPALAAFRARAQPFLLYH